MSHRMERVLQTAGTEAEVGTAMLQLIGQVIHYRTRAMDPADPERMQTVERVLPNMTLVLSDGEYLRRADLTSFRVADRQLVSDLAEPGARDSTDADASSSSSRAPATPSSTESRAPGRGSSTESRAPGAPPAPAVMASKTCAHCGKDYAPSGNAQRWCAACGPLCRTRGRAVDPDRAGRGRKLSDADRQRWAAAVAKVRELQRSGIRRLDAVEQVAKLPEYQGLRLNDDTYQWWFQRLRQTGQIQDTGRLPSTRCRRSGARDSTDANASSSSPRAPGVPPSGGPPPPEGGTPHSADLTVRLLAAAVRLADAEALVQRAERALAILEGTP